MNRTKIANGVYLSAFETEKFKRCRVSLYFIWPATREAATAQALLPLLMERGYADCPDMTELSKRLAALYGASLSVDTSVVEANRVLSVSVTGIKDAYALSGEAVSEAYARLALGVAFTPYFEHGLFSAEAVDIEKEQLREELESEINEKRSYCIRQARRKFFGDAPEGVERCGYLEEVDKLTPQCVTDAFHAMLGTARLEVMVFGANPEAVQRDVLQMLETVQRTPVEPAQPAAMPPVSAQQYVQPMDTVQGKLCLLFTAGVPVPDTALSALRVASALLGGTATSRLFMNVREKQSLCYYCAASAMARTGVLTIDSGVEHENAAAAQQAILAELHALTTGEITEKELSETKKQLTGIFAAVGDTLSSLESWQFREIMRGTDKTPQDAIADIEAVTPDDIHRVLQRFTLSVAYMLTKKEGC